MLVSWRVYPISKINLTAADPWHEQQNVKTPDWITQPQSLHPSQETSWLFWHPRNVTANDFIQVKKKVEHISHEQKNNRPLGSIILCWISRDI